MKVIIHILLIILLAGTAFASGLSEYLLHESPAPTMYGDAIHLEITNTGLDRQIYNPTLFYRQRGELEYKSVSVRDNGFVLSADIPTEKLQSGRHTRCPSKRTRDNPATRDHPGRP